MKILLTLCLLGLAACAKTLPCETTGIVLVPVNPNHITIKQQRAVLKQTPLAPYAPPQTPLR